MFNQEAAYRDNRGPTDVSPWRRCEITSMSDTTLGVILQLVHACVDQRGHYPTVVELKALLLPSTPTS